MHKNTVVGLIVFCIISLIGGCFYSRLSEVKAQFSDVDGHFYITEGEQYSIISREPVLLPEDVVRIMDGRPSAEHTEDGKLYYDYIFEKKYPGEKNEDGNYDITMGLVFIDGKLTVATLDKKFFEVIPKDTFMGIIRAMGKAKIDIRTRKVTATIDGKVKNPHLPDVNEIQFLLGKPYSQQGNTYTYVYATKTYDGVERKSSPLTFAFDKHGQFQKCRNQLLGNTTDIYLSITSKKISKSQTPSDGNSTAIAAN